MRTLVRILIATVFVLLLATRVFARAPQEVPVPIDIAVGPAFHWLPSPLSDGQLLLPGIAIDAYGVISPEVLRENSDRIPSRYRRMVSLDQEMHLKPFWVALMPTTFLIHPGKGHQAYGATWSLVGLDWNVQPLHSLELSARIKLPTVSWFWVQSPRIEEGDVNLVGLGLSPGLEAQWIPSTSFRISASWDQNLYLPLATAEFTPLDKAHEKWTWHGVASLLFHFRIPSLQRI